MRRTAVIAVAGWLAAAAAATATGVAAVTLIGWGLTGPGADEPLRQEEITAALTATPSAGVPGAAGTPAGTPAGSAPASTAGSEMLRTPGGSVIARCSGGQVTLEWWSPAQGYAVGEVRPRHDHEGKVTFERGEEEIEAKVTCVAGVPKVTWERD